MIFKNICDSLESHGFVVVCERNKDGMIRLSRTSGSDWDDSTKGTPKAVFYQTIMEAQERVDGRDFCYSFVV
jgi:hypothetical protein